MTIDEKLARQQKNNVPDFKMLLLTKAEDSTLTLLQIPALLLHLATEEPDIAVLDQPFGTDFS